MRGSDCCALLGGPSYLVLTGKRGAWDLVAAPEVPGIPLPPVFNDALGAPAECTGGDLKDNWDSACLSIHVVRCVHTSSSHQLLHCSQSEGCFPSPTHKEGQADNVLGAADTFLSKDHCSTQSLKAPMKMVRVQLASPSDFCRELPRNVKGCFKGDC